MRRPCSASADRAARVAAACAALGVDAGDARLDEEQLQQIALLDHAAAHAPTEHWYGHRD